MKSKLISIIIPMYFEEKVVKECYNRLTSVAYENNLHYELIFVNDGSTDKTQDLLEEIAKEDFHVKVISFSRNFGHQIAVSAGIDRAKGDALIIIDADLQDPPELIPRMIELWEKGYNIVYGKRKRRDGESLFKLVTAKVFYRVLNNFSNIKIPMDTGDFRLIDKRVVKTLRKMPEHNRFLRGMSSWVGFSQIALEYERKERFAGETKYPLKKMIRFALDGIFSFSSKPVKLIEFLGLGAISSALLFLIYTLVSSSLSLNNTSLNLILILEVIVLVGGVQILSIGIIGEYIIRIYDESKGRPLYVVDKEINLNQNIIHPRRRINPEMSSIENLQKALLLVNDEMNRNKNYVVK